MHLSSPYFLAFVLHCLYIIHHTLGSKIQAEQNPLYIQNGQSATFKWTFQFNYDRIGSLKITHYDIKGQTDGLPLITKFGARGQVTINKNSRFHTRISYQVPNNNDGLLMTLNQIKTEDEGLFVITVDMNDGSRTEENKTSLVVLVKPSIDKQYKSQSKNEDEVALLICKTTGGNPRPMQFQWYKLDKNNVYQPFTSIVLDDIEYNLEIPGVKRNSTGMYKCVVSNRGGSDEHIVELKVTYRPVVTTKFVNRNVFENTGTTEFFCVADGNAGKTEYLWYQHSQDPKNLISELIRTQADFGTYVEISSDKQRLIFTKPPRRFAAKYLCAGQNDLGTGKAVGAMLVVTYIPGPITIANTTQGAVNGKEGEDLRVKCSSDAIPPAKYTWQRILKSDTGVLQYKTLVDNKYSGEMFLYDISTNDTGEYKCTAINYPNMIDTNYRGITEKTVDIKVRYGPRQTNITVNDKFILKDRKEDRYKVEIKENTLFKLECKSHSEPPATYNIQRTDRIMLNPDPNVGIYEVKKMTRYQDGQYKCIATNKVMGNTETKDVYVIVSVAPKMLPPVPETQMKVEENFHLKITCKAEGKPPPKIFWQKYGANITNSNHIKITYTEGRTNPSTKITPVSSELSFSNGILYTDVASYSCITHNFAGKLNNTIAVDVQYAPKIVDKPKNFTVLEDDRATVKFICTAKGNPNKLVWKWLFDDGVTSAKELSISQETPNVLERRLIERKDHGKYICVPANGIGEGENATGILTVEYKPSITQKPDEKVITEIGRTVKLSCKADGVPKPTIVWTKASQDTFKVNGEILEIQNIKVKDIGQYTCKATNKVYHATATSNIIVRHAPIIKTKSAQDTKKGIEIGEQVTLLCIVSSYPAPKLKWVLPDGRGDISRTTDTYEVEITPTDAGGSIKLKFKVKAADQGKTFVCSAENTLGSDSQRYQILGKGKPEAPTSLEASDVIQPTIPVTVNIELKWEPGFSGGYPVSYILLYREETNTAYSKQIIRSAVGNKFVFKNRKSSTKYVFSMIAQNQVGSSREYAPPLEFTTKAEPPDVVKVTFTPTSDGEAIIVSWRILSKPDFALRVRRNTKEKEWKRGVIRYRISGTDEPWKEEVIENIPENGTYIVRNLDPNALYQFHFILYDENGNFGKPFDGGEIYPGGGPTVERRNKLGKNEIIGIGAGVGAFLLLILIIILVIFIHKKKDKQISYSSHYNNGRVQVDIPTSTMRSGGYSDVVRASYLNDEDPFAVDSSVLDETEEKSPPPGYHENHARPDDYTDRVYAGGHSTFRQDEPTPSYTSFGRLPKPNRQPDSNGRAAEITRGNRDSRGNAYLDDYNEPEEPMDPLLRRSITDLDETYNENERRRQPRNNQRYSRENLTAADDDDYRGRIRSPPSVEGGLNNRVPGAFGDKFGASRPKQSGPPKYGDVSSESAQSPPPNDYHQSGRSSPPSSVASSKPYRSDNEYIDETEDNYVGFLV